MSWSASTAKAHHLIQTLRPGHILQSAGWVLHIPCHRQHHRGPQGKIQSSSGKHLSPHVLGRRPSRRRHTVSARRSRLLTCREPQHLDVASELVTRAKHVSRFALVVCDGAASAQWNSAIHQARGIDVFVISMVASGPEKLADQPAARMSGIFIDVVAAAESTRLARPQHRNRL